MEEASIVGICISTRDDKFWSILVSLLSIYVFWFNQDGGTALMCAAATGKCDVVTELISLGADVDIKTNLVSNFLCLIMT